MTGGERENGIGKIKLLLELSVSLQNFTFIAIKSQLAAFCGEEECTNNTATTAHNRMMMIMCPRQQLCEY